MNTANIWTFSYSQDIDAPAEKVWAVLADTSTWSAWNNGVKSIELDGAFVTGSTFTMIVPEGEAIHTKLITVSPPSRFIDETWVDDNSVRVEHSVTPLSAQRCRVTFAAKAQGPEAASAGSMATGDFAEVLAGLATYMTQPEAK